MIFNKLEDYYYKLVYKKEDIIEIEKMIYLDSELENIMSEQDYLKLISLNYKSKYAIEEFYMVANPYIEFNKLETKYILDLLKSAKKLDLKLGDYLIEVYELYCRGYYFLEKLAIDYGLRCSAPMEYGMYKLWNDLTIYQKDELVNKFIPSVVTYIDEAINWIESEKIILTGKKNLIGRWTYIDNHSNTVL